MFLIMEIPQNSYLPGAVSFSLRLNQSGHQLNDIELKSSQMLGLLELILPKEILEYFTITNLLIQNKEVHLYFG